MMLIEFDSIQLSRLQHLEHFNYFNSGAVIYKNYFLLLYLENYKSYIPKSIGFVRL